ncbi:MAG: rod shape-determining protein MreC [Balneolaceae bacterium]
MRLRLPRISDAKDIILTVVILGLSVQVMMQRHENGLQSLRKATVTLISYLETPLSTIRIYRQALNTNEWLQRQNVLLQDELSRLRSVGEQNRILRDLLQFQQASPYNLTPVNVVSKEITTLNNSLTVPAGENQNVRSGMPMITPRGLVGIVTLTANNYSRVMTFTHPLFRVSARIQESRAFGIVSRAVDRSGLLVLEFVPSTIEIRPGQLVESSGYSNQLPAGIPIGEVVDVVQGDNIEMNRIYIEPIVNLHTLAEGFILHYEPDPELDALEESEETF